jgi:hypothetical protein
MRKSWTILGIVAALGLGACGGGSESGSAPTPPGEPAAESTATPTPPPVAAAAAVAADAPTLPRGLLVATSQFRVENGQVTASPGPARLELVTRRDGEWRSEVIEDASSNVFHKALWWAPPSGEPGIVTLSGMAASVKLWRRGASGWQSETLWTEAFGGRFDRMRDGEVANLYGDGPAIAIATHDQGVVATVRPGASGWQVDRLDREPNTFVHEIEIGDLNGDGVLEVYATPSEPNDLGGGTQSGHVVRYVPSAAAGSAARGRTVVADLGNRHAKEIWVGDVDGDGRDELYVAVEALTRGSGASVEIVEPVEIRRYDEGTPPDARVVVARIAGERLTRFLTVGDVDGDGRREMVIASFRSGLWLARPGRDPRGEWSLESIDRESSGFEHAALLTDLDGDGRDELYVGADDQGELRRYLWVNGRPRRETLIRREVPRSVMTWNFMPMPATAAAAP